MWEHKPGGLTAMMRDLVFFLMAMWGHGRVLSKSVAELVWGMERSCSDRGLETGEEIEAVLKVREGGTTVMLFLLINELLLYT